MEDRVPINVLKECGVTKGAPKQAWTKPTLRLLGEIKDVAGPNPNGPQGGGTKS
jgi:hypothetical protein